MNFNNRLVLYPMINKQINIDLQQLVNELLKHKIIAENWQYNNKNYYLAGDNFLKHIVFMGCSPAIALKPDKNNLPGTNFIAVRVVDFKKLVFYPGKKSSNYRCNHCKSTMTLPENTSDISDNLFICNYCHSEYHYSQYNWRRSAGFSQLFIEIFGIFNGEAIPSDHLLSLLARSAFKQTKWNYFYAQ